MRVHQLISIALCPNNSNKRCASRSVGRIIRSDGEVVGGGGGGVGCGWWNLWRDGGGGEMSFYRVLEYIPGG